MWQVETIGDAYMVSLGIHFVLSSDDLHFQICCGLPIQMAKFAVAASKAVQVIESPTDKSPISIRIGLHCGPILADVVGN